MIVVFDGLASRNYAGMGDAVLTPTSCKTRQIAAGAYTLNMVHPIDPWGKWELLREGNIIRAPVQEETISSAWSGQEMWLYDTNAAAVLRDDPSEPSTVYYSEWNGNTDYQVGSRVTVRDYGYRNYRCKYFDPSSAQRYVPPYNSSWWVLIGNSSGGGAVVANLPAGTTLIWISGGTGDEWWYMSTTAGVEGYIKQSYLTNGRHITPEESKARTFKTQLFRIRRATKNSQEMTVTVEAEHVSYDAAGLIVRNADIHQQNAVMSLYKVQEALILPYDRGSVSTNLTASAGTYTQTIRGKSLIYCLLDPDVGIVPTFDAEYRRDNWDLFVMASTDVDRGFRLRYAANLMGVSWTVHDENRVTHVVPVAKAENGDELYLPEIYIVSSLASQSPVIRMERLNVPGQVGRDDGTDTGTTWTEAALLDEMRAKAGERFSVDKVDQSTTEITVDFEMLGDTEEYAQFKRLQKALMYDIVRVVHPRLAPDTLLRVIEIEWDAIREIVTGLKLSNVNDHGGGTVTGYTVRGGSLTTDKLSSQAVSEIVDSAVDRAVQILS